MARKETGITVTNVAHNGFVTTTTGYANVTVSNGMVYIPLPTANTVYTDSIYIGDNMLLSNIGMASILNGVQGSASVIITMEEGWRKPNLEGSADPVYVALQTQTITAVATWNYTALLSASNAAIVPYIRFKLGPTASSINTSSTVNIVVMEQVSG
jgi:hypothetical protein